MILDVLWYFTAILAVWGASLGGVSVPMLGLLYPFRIVAAILFIFLIFKSKIEDWKISKNTWFTIIPVLIYMLLHSLISLIWAQDQLKTVKAILNFAFVAIFLFMFMRFVKDKKSLDRLLIALSANFFIILAIGIYEAFTSDYHFADPAGVDISWRANAYGVSYPVVCFTNPNDFSFAITLTLPLVLYVLDEALLLKKWQRTFGKMLIIAMAFFNIMHTCSRLGYIVFFVVLAVYLIMQFRKSIQETLFLGLLAIFLLLSMTQIIQIDYGVDEKDGKAQPLTMIGATDTSTQIRILLLKQGLRVTRDTLGLGAGAKNSPAFMARYPDMEETGGITDYHFFYMELLADYGVIPLLMLLCFQGGAFYVSIYILRKRPEDRWMAICSLPGIVGFTLASGNSSSNMFVFVMWIQFAIWSLMMSKAGYELYFKRNGTH